MPPDLQEALSIRYSAGLRLALLTSGNWALWRGDEPVMVIPAYELNMRFLTDAAMVERFARETAQEAYERRQAAGWDSPTVVGKATRTLEDMGL